MPGQHPFKEVNPTEVFPIAHPEHKFPREGNPDKNLLWDYVFDDKLDDKSTESK